MTSYELMPETVEREITGLPRDEFEVYEISKAEFEAFDLRDHADRLTRRHKSGLLIYISMAKKSFPEFVPPMPHQHQEEVFKAILGNCQSVVNYLGTIRNKIGDAHGQGKLATKPKARHAELAVNLAGTMASFLVSTWDERSARLVNARPGP